MTSQVEPVHRKEVFGLTLVLLTALGVQLWFRDPVFNGPDAISNFKFAVSGQDWNYWFEPDAFLHYLFPMGYGSFLAIVTRFTGGSYFPIQLIQIGLALSMAWMGWLLTRHISRVARVATFVVIALSPAALWLARTNGYEILISFFMMLSLTLLWGVGGQPHATKSILQRCFPALAGLAIGLCMLCQGKTIIVLPVLIYLVARWGKVQTWLFLTVAAIPPVLWGIRNHFVLGTWNPFNSSSEVVMWMGNNWTTQTGGYVQVPPPLPAEYSGFYEASLNFIVTQPEKAYELLLFRMARLLEPTYIYPDFGGIKGANLVLHFTSIAFAIVAVLTFAAYVFGRLWAGPPTLPAVGPIAVMVLLFALVHIPFATETRHLQPIVPIALAVSVPTLILLLQKRRIRSRLMVRKTQ